MTVGNDSFKNLKSRSKLKKRDDNGDDSEDTEKAGTKGTFKDDEAKSPAAKSPTKSSKPPRKKKT